MKKWYSCSQCLKGESIDDTGMKGWGRISGEKNFLCRFGFLRLGTIKNCPHMLKSDHRGLRISEGKFSWWWVVGGGGGWYEVTTGTVLI